MLMRYVSKAAVALAIVAGLATSAQAHVITVTSYEGPNGQGMAAGGWKNYWDLLYNGQGNTSTDSAPLSGGVGDLTDGVTTDLNWSDAENHEGTGPYVGWKTFDPLLKFNLAETAVVRQVRVHVDNSWNGGVALPSAIAVTIAGVETLFPVSQDTTNLAPRWVEVNVPLNLPAVSTLTVQLFRGDQWVFADEIQIMGVPEPTWLGWIAAGGLMLRRGHRGGRRGEHRAPAKTTAA